MGNYDLMNLLLCVGRDTSAVVRKAYLQDNDSYLDYCLQQMSRYEKILHWLDHNEVEWKKWCHGVKSDSSVHSISLTTEQVKKKKLGTNKLYRMTVACLFTKEFREMTAHSRSRDTGEMMKFLDRCNGAPGILIAVGNTKLAPLTGSEEARYLIDNEEPDIDGKIVLSLYRDKIIFLLIRDPPFHLD